LRGGEPTIEKLWFEKYVNPALEKNLHVILESNGYFIGKEDYEDLWEKLEGKDIEIRISFDEIHLAQISKNKQSSEFYKMAKFANDAIEKRIKFGFFCLAMDKKQIKKFINNTPLENYDRYFHSLVYYNYIQEIELKGEYIDVKGIAHKKITG